MKNLERPLAEILFSVKNLLLSANGNLNFIPSSISANSKKIKKNSVFIAIKGEKTDGHLYIPDAIKAGASAIIFQDATALKSIQIPASTTLIRLSDTKKAHLLITEYLYDYPARKLKLIGITGTNGKTSSAFITQKIINQTLGNCGLISTVQYSSTNWSIPAAQTTPELETLQELFLKMLDSNCKFVSMEASSHALHQNRLGSAKFAAAIFTNLTGDHLDYHLNMENYFHSKKKLFTEYLSDNAPNAINIDDPYGFRLFDELKSQYSISCAFNQNAQLKIFNFSMNESGSTFSIALNNKTYHISTNLLGKFNAMNISQVIAICSALGCPVEKIIQILKENLQVPGRLERFTLSNGAIAFVDYAHSDDALQNVLSTLREIKKNRIITVFGCGGNRDASKRPRMGRVAEKFSDFIVLTNDNPRYEDPHKIISDITSGISNKKILSVIPDRREAINFAVSISQKDDIILIAGKGHETGQQIGDTIIPYSDRDEIQKYL